MARFFPAIAVGLAILILDQLTKAWILGSVFAFPTPWQQGLWHPPIEVTGFFNLVMVWNRGVSFGLFAAESDAQRWLLVAVAVAISVVLAVWLGRTPRPGLKLLLAAIIGGAIGNVIDRVRFGAVADFVDLHVLGYHWPAFNVADAAISIGAVILALDMLRPDPPKGNGGAETAGADGNRPTE